MSITDQTCAKLRVTSAASEILTAAQMRAAEHAAVNGAVGDLYPLMERAGAALADRIAALSAPCAILFACGPGNNGGDGYVAARILRQLGWPVRVAALAEPALQTEAARARASYEGAIDDLHGLEMSAFDIVVDGLFGIGLNRAITGRALEAIRAIAAWRACPQTSGRPPRRIIAIDIPSGLIADDNNRDNRAGSILSADHCVTFFRKKFAHVLLPGNAHCGAVFVEDIGIADSVLTGMEPQPAREIARSYVESVWPWPVWDTHKYRRGAAMVVCGGPNQTGAARLAARSALRVGAGLVTLLAPDASIPVIAAHETSVMMARLGAPDELAALTRRARSVLVGPALGLDDLAKGHVLALCAVAKVRPDLSLILDADALTLLAQELPARIHETLNIREAASRVVLTPHEGEFNRLFPDLTLAPDAKHELRRSAITEAARRSGVVIILKGPNSLVAHPDGRLFVNETGSPFLATAGSGDVLAGLVTGLMAQGLLALEAAKLACWLHGFLGERSGPGLIAEDLVAAIKPALAALAPPAA